MADNVTVATYGLQYQADLARATLESAGIPSVVVVDDAGGALAGLSLSGGGVRLLVNANDVEEAKRVLADEGE